MPLLAWALGGLVLVLGGLFLANQHSETTDTPRPEPPSPPPLMENPTIYDSCECTLIERCRNINTSPQDVRHFEYCDDGWVCCKDRDEIIVNEPNDTSDYSLNDSDDFDLDDTSGNNLNYTSGNNLNDTSANNLNDTSGNNPNDTSGNNPNDTSSNYLNDTSRNNLNDTSGNDLNNTIYTNLNYTRINDLNNTIDRKPNNTIFNEPSNTINFKLNDTIDIHPNTTIVSETTTDKSLATEKLCGQLESHVAIIAGYPNYREFPWMSTIWKKQDGNALLVYLNFGALVHPRAVLTDGNVTRNTNASDLIVRIGEFVNQGTNVLYTRQDRMVDHIRSYLQYKDVYTFEDYALLVLSAEIDMTTYVNTVCLPEPEILVDSSRCISIKFTEGDSYGGLGSDYRIIPETVQLSLTDQSCPVFWKISVFCSSESEFRHSPYKFKLGTPLVCPMKEDPTRYVLTGISVSPRKLPDGRIAELFTDVIRHTNNIMALLQRKGEK